MFVRSTLALSALVIVVILIAGCSGPLLLPVPPSPTPTRAPATQPPAVAPANTAIPAGQPAPAVQPAKASTPVASPSAAKPTATPFPVVPEEEDCMAGCHIPSPHDLIAEGAMPQPADHKGRTTCLNCHAVAQKQLPETHVGRLDPSCTVCHK